MTTKKLKTAVQVVCSNAILNMVSSPIGKSYDKKHKTVSQVLTLALYFGIIFRTAAFLSTCQARNSYIRIETYFFLTLSGFFVQAK